MRRKGLESHLDNKGLPTATNASDLKGQSGAKPCVVSKQPGWWFVRFCAGFLCLWLSLAFAVQKAGAGDFSFQWGTTHNWTANALGPTTYTLTDPYGFQVDVRLGISRIGGSALTGYPDDLLTSGSNAFGSETSIWLVWDSNSGSSGIGESTNTATMEILSGGLPFSAGVLSFRVSDIDSVDNNGATDRCDFVTATGNAGNPALSYVSGAVASRSVQIGPGPGSGSTGFIGSNQAQCIYNTGTTGSNSSNGDDFGSILVTYPAGTHTATIAYDESIENVYGVNNRDAAARGVGIWGATILSVNQTISLAKSTATTSYSALGQTIAYTYVVTNNGPLPIRTGQNIQIQDDKIGTFTCGSITSPIASGGTHTCTASYTVNAGDMSASNITNNAVAGVGTGAQSFATRLQSNTAQVVVPRRPTVAITKVSNGAVGGFVFTGTNGWTSQTITTTTSGVGVTGPTQTLTAASTATTITETIPAGYQLTSVNCTGMVAGGTATPNLATGAVVFNAAATAPGSNIACTFTNQAVATLTLEKTVTNGTAADTDWTLEFTGPVSGSGVEGNSAITSVVVPVGTYTLAESGGPANYDLRFLTCTGAADTSTDPLNPQITLAIGEVVTCTFENRRGRTITLLKEVVGGPAADTDWTLSAVSAQINKSGVEGDSSITGTGANAATITLSETGGPGGYTLTGLSCVGTVDTGTSVATPQINVDVGEHAFCTFTNTFTPSFSITKDVDLASLATTGLLTYTVTITNTGGSDLTSPVLVDTLVQNGNTLTLASGPSLSGDVDSDNQVDASEIWVYTSTYSVTQANLDDGNDIANTATFDTAETGPQSDDAITSLVAAPSLTVTKVADDNTNVTVGQVITYTYTITNDGNQTISNITLSDNVTAGSGTVPAPNPDTAILTDNGTTGDSTNPTTGDNDWDTLAPGDVLTVTATYTVTQSDVDMLQ